MRVPFLFAGREFEALECGGCWWPAEQALLVADLHLEKASWFAARGQFLPPHDSLDTLGGIERAVAITGAKRLFALGDSFHDRDGPARLEPRARAMLAGLMARLEWWWIDGNHDGASAGGLGGATADALAVDGVRLRHRAEPDELLPEISGHWHPKVRLNLRAGRTVSRRCFARTATKLVLPAYGALTGGLDIGAPELRAAMGGRVTGLVPTRGGMLMAAA
jgi:DNA ligase-associated metallophosphoesterase